MSLGTQLSRDVGRLLPQLINEELESQKPGVTQGHTSSQVQGRCEDPGLLLSSPWIYLLKLPQLGDSRTKRGYRGHGTRVRGHSFSARPYWSGPNSLFRKREGFKPLKNLS